MITSEHPPSGSSKATWTDADFVRWVEPAPPEQHFTFWVAPATLVFERAWHFEGQNFDLRLRASGYRQFLRMPPQHVPGPVLTLTQRKGLSFSEQSFVHQ